MRLPKERKKERKKERNSINLRKYQEILALGLKVNSGAIWRVLKCKRNFLCDKTTTRVVVL